MPTSCGKFTPVVAFAPFADQPVWLAWALEAALLKNGKRGRPTKIPYAATASGPARRGFGSSTDPAAWGVRAQAEARAPQLLGGYITTTGIGMALGNGCEDSLYRAGIDLDSSISDG